MRDQFNALKAIIDAQLAVITNLQSRVGILEAQIPPKGALSVESVASTGDISSGGLVSGDRLNAGNSLTLGRWYLFVDGNGNLAVNDTFTSYNTTLTQVPI